MFRCSLLPLTFDENIQSKRSYSTRTYIDTENGVKRTVTDLSNTKTEKKVYDLTYNNLLEQFIDEKLDDNTFTIYNPKNKTTLKIKDNKW